MGLMYTNNRWKQWGNKTTVIHEVGHGVYNSFRVLSTRGRGAMRRGRSQRWIGTEKERYRLRREIDGMYKKALRRASGHRFPTSYAKTNASEFFCESYAHYVTKPGSLRRTNRPMYDFLRDNIFKGMEYTDTTFDATVK